MNKIRELIADLTITWLNVVKKKHISIFLRILIIDISILSYFTLIIIEFRMLALMQPVVEQNVTVLEK